MHTVCSDWTGLKLPVSESYTRCNVGSFSSFSSLPHSAPSPNVKLLSLRRECIYLEQLDGWIYVASRAREGQRTKRHAEKVADGINQPRGKRKGNDRSCADFHSRLRRPPQNPNLEGGLWEAGRVASGPQPYRIHPAGSISLTRRGRTLCRSFMGSSEPNCVQ